jgi:hypothetical protein
VPEFFTDEQIAALIAEPKPLPRELAASYPPLRRSKVGGHKEAQYEVSGSAGNDFRIIIRQNDVNALDFSAILAYQSKTTHQVFRLRRYNGKSHEHSNRLEKSALYAFHIHQATERYQREGEKEDSYAEPTDRYSDLVGAIDCLIADCGFRRPTDVPPRLL